MLVSFRRLSDRAITVIPERRARLPELQDSRVQDRAITVIPGRRMAASPESIFQRPVRMFSAAGVHGFRAASLRSAPGMTVDIAAEPSKANA